MTAAPDDLRPLIAQVAAGRALSESEAEAAFEIIMSGNATPSQMGAFLMALRVRGETVDEITGAARIMRAKAVAIDAPAGTIDTCGTGGDSSGTFNVSTASALVVAGCGVPVAKHGNRALSSDPARRHIDGRRQYRCRHGNRAPLPMDIGIGFLMAPRHHSAMRHVGSTCVELTRTIFNLLGPLSNPPARAASGRCVRPRMGRADGRGIGRLAKHAWVVHGSGIDEINTAGATTVAEFGRPCAQFRDRPRMSG